MSEEPENPVNGLAEASTAFKSIAPAQASATPKHIVAIGASAGGLDPLQIFFDMMTSDSDMAFVVVQHLSPDYKSLMVELLSRHTDMTIHRVTDRMTLEPNSIYLIPAGKEMIISNHRLLLSDREEGGHLHLPIDTFMRSLAEDKGEDAVAIILSGSGSDGCRGAAEIRNSGGFVLVQAPETATFDGMPNAAIQNRSANLVLAPSDMPEILKRHISGERFRIAAEGDPVTVLDPLPQILDMLRKRFGPDFGYYKDSTVGRRIKRRAGLKRIPELIAYVQFLKDNPDELEALYHDLLIGVTAFFRDSEAFNALEQIVVPQLAQDMSAERPLRIWVPACATGEEAYSIAMLFAEHADRAGIAFNLKIFATDVHEGSLQVASEGAYTQEMLSGVSQSRQEEFFEPTMGAFKISNRIRRCVVFSKHNILRDPPFTKMDLISCRNLLIYFTDIAQNKVLSLFHFALRRSGFLFLGSSETVAKLESQLEIVEAKQRIYTKTRDIRTPDAIQHLPVSTGRETKNSGLHVSEARSRTQSTRQVQAGYDLLLKQYAPPSLLVDANGEVLHVFGDAVKFLRLPRAGMVTTRAVDLVRGEFGLLLGPALDRTLRHGIRTATQDIRMVVEAVDVDKPESTQLKESIVRLTIEPLKSPSELRPHFAMVKFEMGGPDHELASATNSSAHGASVIDDETVKQRIAEMEHRLKSSEENLQSTIEELETSNEELQAANEEMQASNEELQSTNEELHSVNEELHTVSSEHEAKISELSQVNQDVDNLLRSTDIGTIFVDGQMRIRKFTPAAANILNLVSHDIGRMIDHVTYRFNDRDFYDLVKRACEGGEPIEREVEVEDSGWYLLRIRPYRQEGRKLDGAVITFVDVEELRESREQALIARQRMESFLFAATDWLWETDKRHRVTFVTDGLRTLKHDPATVVGRPFWELFGGDPGEHDHWQLQIASMNAHNSFRSFEVAVPANKGSTRYVSLSGTPLFDENDNFIGYRGTTQDITDRHETDMRLSQAESRYRIMYNSAPVLMHSTDSNGYVISVSDFWLSRMGYDRSEVIGQHIQKFYGPASEGCSEFVLGELADGRRVNAFNCTVSTKNDSSFEAMLWAVPELDPDGNLFRSLEVIADVSELRRTSAELAIKNTALTEANHELERFNYVASHDLRSPLRSCNLVLSQLVDDIEGVVDPAIRDQFRLINDRLLQMESMLGDLLNYAQISRNDLEVERIKLDELLEETLMLIQPPADFSIVSDVDGVTIDANPMIASHVLRNLIENAIIHHDHPQGRIDITAKPVDGGVELTIADDGPGIHPRYHDKVFELFGRISGDKPGDGLGLTLVKRAMTKSGGSIALHSTETDRGCVFQLFWPNKQIEASTIIEPAA